MISHLQAVARVVKLHLFGCGFCKSDKTHEIVTSVLQSFDSRTHGCPGGDDVINYNYVESTHFRDHRVFLVDAALVRLELALVQGVSGSAKQAPKPEVWIQLADFSGQ